MNVIAVLAVTEKLVILSTLSSHYIVKIYYLLVLETKFFGNPRDRNWIELILNTLIKIKRCVLGRVEWWWDHDVHLRLTGQVHKARHHFFVIVDKLVFAKPLAFPEVVGSQHEDHDVGVALESVFVLLVLDIRARRINRQTRTRPPKITNRIVIIVYELAEKIRVRIAC